MGIRGHSADTAVGRFADDVARDAYLGAYDEVLAMMPGSLSHEVDTSWGTVRIHEWRGDPAVPPVVLLPGRSSGAPMWRQNLSGFGRRHTVFAVDTLGDAGRSTQTRPFENADDVTGWIGQALDGLGVARIHMVGHSFGGGYAAGFAFHCPERIATLSLLEPAFALATPPVSTLLWASVATMGFLPSSWRDHALARMVGADSVDMTSDDPLARMIKAATVSFHAALPTPRTLTRADLGAFPVPVYVALADRSGITGAAAAANARRIPGAAVNVWPGTTHSLPMEVPDELADELNTFWSAHETDPA